MGSRPLFVLVRRAPVDVVASLAKREGFSAAKSYHLWLQHTLDAERHTRSHERVLLDFDSFLDDNGAALATVERASGQPWPAPGPSADGSFVDPALARSTRAEASPGAVPPWVEEADQALRCGMVGREKEMRATFDRITDNLRAEAGSFDPDASDTISDLRLQLGASRRQGAWYEAEWQKARARAEASRGKLVVKQQEIQRLKDRVFNNDKIVS